MCGIAGICGASQPDLESRLQAMLDSIAHRRPDGQGVYVSPDRMVGLAHKRLSIIDPEGGQQPLGNEDGTIQVTFNGCIYNYQDIARELRQHGHVFRTHCDTEVIVHAYEQWGANCVTRFNGMWAFAVWDSRKQVLFASRDRVGVKPFYYSFDGQTLGFASEIKALLAGKLIAAKPDMDGLRQYLTFQFCLNSTTMFSGVHKLQPGHSLTWSPGRAPQVTCYWDIHFDMDQEHDESYFTDRLRYLLEDAVRLRLRADVPLGAHLSGGLDSSVVVCLTRMLLGEAPVKTFTGAFHDGPAYDETQYAKLVARSAGTDYHECFLTAGQFQEAIPKIIWHMDEPAAGPGVFPQFFVSQLASQHVKVVLGGQGGDEVFIGYARYLVAYLEECIRGAIENTAHQTNYVATLESVVSSLPSLGNYIPMLKTFWREGLFDHPARRYFRLMDRFSESAGLLSSDVAADMDGEKTFSEFHGVFESHGAAAMINRIFCFDLKTHLQSLMHVEDRTSMAFGLESRVPLLDYRLIELMTSVPPVVKFRNGRLKGLFLETVKNVVPREILERRDKMGFPVPLNRWARGELKDFIHDVLLSRKAQERGLFDPDAIRKAVEGDSAFSRSLWGAICLELWHRQFMDK